MYDIAIDEDRELLNIDNGESESELYSYCCGTKWLLELECSTCKHQMVASCCMPFAIIADTVSVVPLMIINNIKLCIRW